MGGRGRTFILLGVVLLLGAVLAVVFLLRPSPDGGATATPTPPPTEIVVAMRDIAFREEIVSGTVGLRPWPEGQVPPGALMSVDEALGQYAQFDIPMGLPILEGMVGSLQKTVRPSELPGQIPGGKVAVALPVSRLSSVGYALQPGDHVDALASFWLLDLDEEFQTQLVNRYVIAMTVQDTVMLETLEFNGRDRNSVLGFPAIEQPSEAQRPRLVAQLTVQNMVVLGVGDWLSQMQPAPAPVETQQQPPAEATPVPAAAPAPDIVTVVVDPQDALALKFLRESGAMIDLVLRSSEDAEGTFATESVTLQYMFTRFNITQPPKLPYGIEPKPTEAPLPPQ